MSESKVIVMTHAARTESEAKLVPLLLSISKSTRALVGIKLAEHGFHNGQDELLISLEEGTPISVSHVADALSVRPSTVSKMLDRLIAKGLVQRTGNARDARRTMVLITLFGLDTKSKLMKLHGEIDADLLNSLEDGAEDTLQALENLAVLLKQRLSRLR